MDQPPEDRTYEYKGLQDPQEIRPLALEPESTSEEVVQCCLTHALLSDNPSYETLSYVRGDAFFTRTILCEGKEIRVTDNLYTALRNLRHETKARVIWADAICINQSDIRERNHQVRIMGEIYSKAQQTIIWLGKDGEQNADRVFDCIRLLDAYISDHADGYGNKESYSTTITMAGQWKAKLCNFDYEPLAPLFDRPWFRRLWVVQETALARQVLLKYGNSYLPWDTLVKVTHALDEMGVFPFMLRYVNDMALQNHSPHGKQYQVLACTDPRDRIYSLLSLAWTEGITADYGLRVEDVFRNFALWILGSVKELQLLSYAGGVSNISEFELPSWIPMPTLEHSDYSLLTAKDFHASSEVLYSSIEVTARDLCNLREENVLCFKGMIVDSIAILAMSVLVNDERPRGEDGWEEYRIGYLDGLLECVAIAEGDAETLSPEKHDRFGQAMTFELTIAAERAPPEYSVWLYEYLESGSSLNSQTELGMGTILTRVTLSTVLYLHGLGAVNSV